VREVFEESGAKADIIKYLSKISYEFIRNTNENNIRIKKIVHWFIMEAKDMECRPQKNEGFIETDYYTLKNAIKLARYDDERSVIEKAVKEKSNVDFKWN